MISNMVSWTIIMKKNVLTIDDTTNRKPELTPRLTVGHSSDTLGAVINVCKSRNNSCTVVAAITAAHASDRRETLPI